ncbi:hypothetical protein GL2_22240 [Microbulbifer sp. GL-2]|nr:hypothetical protein GL2_22240 [Microbulbifer sp. GL-2]
MGSWLIPLSEVRLSDIEKKLRHSRAAIIQRAVYRGQGVTGEVDRDFGELARGGWETTPA